MSDEPPVQAPQRSLPLFLRAIAVRLRFVLVVAAAALVAAGWPSIRSQWERLTASRNVDGGAVGLDSEFFCPMCPGVASTWPSKCPVCHMTLVRRQKGEAAVLPDGVVARMQLTPYRVQLAGVRTVVAEHIPLEREIVTMGKLSGGEIEATVDPSDLPLVRSPTSVQVAADSLPSRPTVAGKIKKIAGSKVVVSIPVKETSWPDGLLVSVRIASLVAEHEPFLSRSQIPALTAASPRVVYRCPNHPESPRMAAGKCPIDALELERRRLADNERVDWWCPMHPKVTADSPGRQCKECNGMVLLPRVTAFAPAGRVLAVPRSAVLQTGNQQIVYVQTMPGMFDGRIVKLGAPAGDFYPVLEGIAAGERVVASGAFLLDAESRLNPSLAAAYFGATGGSRNSATPSPPVKPEPSSKTLSVADKKLAAAQKICPVTMEPLDSMGGPVRVEVSGRVVFICCEGCEEELRSNPKKYFAKIPPSPGP